MNEAHASSFYSFIYLFLSYLTLQTTMLQAIERYMKQAIVDKVPSVSSSALVSSLVNKCYSCLSISRGVQILKRGRG